MFKFSTLVVFLILGFVAQLLAAPNPCVCQTLQSRTGTILGDLYELIDEVVSEVIEPIVEDLEDGSRGVLESNILDIEDVLESEGDQDEFLDNEIDVGMFDSDRSLLDEFAGDDMIENAVSEVEVLVHPWFGGIVDVSFCADLDFRLNKLFYHFNSDDNNYLTLYGYADVTLHVALFSGGCDDLTCMYLDLEFCGASNELAIAVQPKTDYYLGIFGDPCDFIINYDLSRH